MNLLQSRIDPDWIRNAKIEVNNRRLHPHSLINGCFRTDHLKNEIKKRTQGKIKKKKNEQSFLFSLFNSGDLGQRRTQASALLVPAPWRMKLINGTRGLLCLFFSVIRLGFHTLPSFLSCPTLTNSCLHIFFVLFCFSFYYLLKKILPLFNLVWPRPLLPCSLSTLAVRVVKVT